MSRGNSPTANKNQIETMVAGVALLDYGGDSYLDVYLVNGAEIPSLEKVPPANPEIEGLLKKFDVETAK